MKFKFIIILGMLCVCIAGCSKIGNNESKSLEHMDDGVILDDKVKDEGILVDEDIPLDEDIPYNEGISLNEDNIDENNKTNINENIPRIEEVDYSEYFNGINGSAVFYSSNSNTYQIYNKQMSEEQVSPCSTFKIISTLIGLEKGVIDSVDSTMNYDNSIYPRDSWNKDMGLKEAFGTSCVWYFKKVIDQVGKEEIQETLNQLEYGNCDISEWDGSGINPMPDLNGFWIESSLKISPKEQVEVLANIFSGKADFTEQSIEILKEVMLISQNESTSIYGKTGKGYNDNAWFIGMVDNKVDTYYFAVHLNDIDSNGVSGATAKEIALEIIEQYYTN